MVQAAGEYRDEFINTPEGAPTCPALAERNDLNQFELAITEKTALSADTFMFKFAFPNPDWLPGLPISKHYKLFMPGEEDGEWEGRFYTPVSPLT